MDIKRDKLDEDLQQLYDRLSKGEIDARCAMNEYRTAFERYREELESQDPIYSFMKNVAQFFSFSKKAKVD